MASPSRSLWLVFGKAQKKIKFHAIDDAVIGRFDDLFEDFPFTSDPEPVFALPHEPRINSTSGLPRKLPFPKFLAWGNGMDTDSSVVFTGFHIEGDDSTQKRKFKFCVKVLFNIEKTEPDDYCYKAADKMIADAKFYGENLRSIAGVLVPRHHGVWRAQTRWGGAMLCSITEWAGTSWTQLVDAGRDTVDLKIHIGRTVERLHDRGIHHHGLYSSAELRHVLFRVDKTTAGSKPTCFVIDFSKAIETRCPRNLPILPHDADIRMDTPRCREASNLNYILGFYKVGLKLSPPTNLYRAIRFCERYSALHPSLSKAEVMLVQRHHFFAGEPPLEPDITFGFRPDGKVVFDGKDGDTLTVTDRLPEEYISFLSS